MKLNIEAPEPGIYEGVPFEDYLKIQAVSNSYLSRLAITPAHARVVEPDTISKSTGRMIHTYTLEGKEEFLRQHKVVGKMNRNTKVWKELVREAVIEGKELINKDDYEQIAGVGESVLNYPGEAISGEVEQTVIWETSEGILCKARPDVMQSATGTIFDLKTTKDAGDFQRAICNYGYHRQAVHYMRGCNAVSPYLFDKFVFLAVETKPPYRIQSYDLHEEAIATAEQEVDDLIQIELNCISADNWPNYTMDYHGGYRKTAELPLYYLNRGNR